MSTQVEQGPVAIEVLKIGGLIGAEVKGIKLSGDLEKDTIETIRTALLKHKVLFFRGQSHLDDEGQEAFADALGEPFAHPTVKTKEGSRYILELDSHHGGRANSWHTDITFIDAYPSASILRAVTVPDAGGDTVWANTAAAYESLPSDLQQLADKLWAIHTNLYDYAARKPDATEEAVKQYQRTFASTVYETEHPLVRVHPETGEKSLVLGHFVKRILGVSSSESARLFEIFQSHATSLENSVRWRWSQGDVVIWDNRATQHIAVNDYGDAHRVVRRVTLAGEVPVSVDGRTSRTYLKTPNEQR